MQNVLKLISRDAWQEYDCLFESTENNVLLLLRHLQKLHHMQTKSKLIAAHIGTEIVQRSTNHLPGLSALSQKLTFTH